MALDLRRDLVTKEIGDRFYQLGGCRFVLHLNLPAAPAAAANRSRFPTSAVRSSRAPSSDRGRCESAASCRHTSPPSAGCPSLPRISPAPDRRGGPPPHS